MSTNHAPSLASVLAQGAPDTAARREMFVQMRRVVAPLLVATLLALAWAAVAPLAGAVVAPAVVKVELERKTVQHAEGGIVREILVRDGQAVRAGDALLVIGDARGQAELALLQDQWRAARLRAARADAQARLAPRFVAPDDLAADPRAAEHFAREQAVFEAHRRALDEQVSLLHGQVRQAQAQAEALESQIAATSRSASLSDEELAINEQLLKDGFIHRTRLIGLQRISADYASRIGEHRSELASSRQRAAEVGTRIAQLRLAHQARAADELRDASALVRELAERLAPSRDQVERQTVRAPVDGTAMALRVAAPGAVVGPREPLLDVVPAREKLVIDARVATQDIEHVRHGGAAEVRLLGSDAQQRAPLPARVVFVSPDRRTDPEGGAAWFDVTVEVDLAGLPEQPVLRPGMPAELYVATASRTLIEYLARPLGLFTQRALREP